MLQYVDHNHHDVIFFLEVGGGGRDSIVSTLEALRVISINFVLVISMIIDNHHDAFFFFGGGRGGGGRAGGAGENLVLCQDFKL